jgi:pimeloyl-ACP methyl ester carboxylesterase
LKLSWRLFAISWAIILAGCALANAIQTAGGVHVEKVMYEGASGVKLAAMLYRPSTATPEHKAPAIMASHGLINTREMQSAFAIELARRGYVVLAIDMTGHGWSGGVLRSDGYGGPDSLKYLRSLPYVDVEKIGLEGHSLGGGPVQAAAAAMPDGYKAMVLEGSTTLFGGPAMAKGPGPRNLAIVFGQYDEFAQTMWGERGAALPMKGSEVGGSTRMKALFHTEAPVENGKVYGDIAQGAARVLYQPAVNHPGEHFSTSGVGYALDWFGQTLGAPTQLATSNQIWLWKDIGTLIAYAGFVLLLMGTFELLLSLPVFAAMREPARPASDKRGWRWWAALAATIVIPAATFYTFMGLGNDWFKPSTLFPQAINNQLVVWALLNGVISLALGFVLARGKTEFTHRVAGAIGIAVITAGVGYLSLVLADAVFNVDFRFWVLGLKPIGMRRFVAFLTYLPFFLAFFLIGTRALVSGLAVRGESFLVGVGTAKVAMAAGFAGLLAIQYVSMATTGRLASPDQALNTIVAYQFIPVLATVGVIGAWTYRRTNSWLPGAILSALFVTLYVVSGTAFYPPPAAAAPAAAAATPAR